MVFYTIQEVADMLRADALTIRAKIIKGEIPAVDITPLSQRRTWRVREDELMAWLGNNSNTVSAEQSEVKEYV